MNFRMGRDPSDRVTRQVNEQLQRINVAFQDVHKRLRALEGQGARAAEVQAMNDDAARQVEEYESRGRAYTQVLLLIGYGGFFALWSQTVDKMSLWMFASTGLGILVSMLTFIAYEVATTYVQSTAAIRFRAASPDGRGDALAVRRAVKDALAALDRYYKAVFLVTAISGFGSGISLLFWFIWTTILAAWQLGA